MINFDARWFGRQTFTYMRNLFQIKVSPTNMPRRLLNIKEKVRLLEDDRHGVNFDLKKTGFVHSLCNCLKHRTS